MVRAPLRRSNGRQADDYIHRRGFGFYADKRPPAKTTVVTFLVSLRYGRLLRISLDTARIRA
jgi:hypothetical protein